MSVLWRRLQRANKKAAKFHFNITCKELIFDCARKWRPEQIVIACMHRRRRHTTNPKKVEWSCDNPNRAIVVWPDAYADPLNLTTTLFRNLDQDQYDDKEWTLIVEEKTAKGKYRPLAAVPINIRLFITDLPGVQMEAKFKLRPLRKEVQFCTLQLVLTSSFLKEGDMIEEDLQSLASAASVMIDEPVSVSRRHPIPEHITDELPPLPPKEEVSEIITKISDDIQKWANSAKFDEDKKDSNEHLPDPVIRPHWRVENEQKMTEKIEKTEKKEIIIEKPKMEDHVVPESIPGEPLKDWCVRVTTGYKNVAVNNFTKSFKSGLAFCAIIHRYRPDLIEFTSLDFSETNQGWKSNCRKAFGIAALLGVEKTLDESETVILPDRGPITEFLIQLRLKLEGEPSFENSAPYRPPSRPLANNSDHRMSAMFALTEQEERVMADYEDSKRIREIGQNQDEMDKSFGASTSKGRVETAGSETPQLSRKKYEDKQDNGFNGVTDDVQKIKSLANDVNSLHLNSADKKKEQLRMKARQMLQNPTTTVIDSERNEERQKRHQEEARRLLEDATSRNPMLNTATPPMGQLRRCSSVRSTTSNASMGSITDLRTLDTITAQTSFRTFKKLQPSPNLQRKNYDSPILPAFSLPTSRSNGEKRNRTMSPSKDPPGQSAFDRVRRFGSMRGQEWADSIAQLVTTPKMEHNRRGVTPVSNSQNPTPTRKVIDRVERDIQSGVDLIVDEQQKIKDRLKEIEESIADLRSKREAVATGSEEEERLITSHLRLVTEKADLLQQEEYFNGLSSYFDIKEKTEKVRNKLHLLGEAKTDAERKLVDDLMAELEKLIVEQVDLHNELLEKNNKEEEGKELGRQTLERTKNFNRGIQEPLSASKRLMGLFR